MRETKRRRSVQTIMRMLIRLGRYGADDFNATHREYGRRRYMCIAAGIALDNHEITPEEYERVCSAIDAYLGNHGTLHLFMREAGLVGDMTGDEFACTVGRELYWDWGKRPHPKRRPPPKAYE